MPYSKVHVIQFGVGVLNDLTCTDRSHGLKGSMLADHTPCPPTAGVRSKLPGCGPNGVGSAVATAAASTWSRIPRTRPPVQPSRLAHSIRSSSLPGEVVCGRRRLHSSSASGAETDGSSSVLTACSDRCRRVLLGRTDHRQAESSRRRLSPSGAVGSAPSATSSDIPCWSADVLAGEPVIMSFLPVRAHRAPGGREDGVGDRPGRPRSAAYRPLRRRGDRTVKEHYVDFGDVGKARHPVAG